MKIPLSYSVKNVFVRKATSLMAILGISLVICVFISILALRNGFAKTISKSGEADNILILRKGSQSEMSSVIPKEVLDTVSAWPEIAQTPGERPQALVSPELIVVVVLKKQDGKESNVLIRGVTPLAFEVHRKVQVQNQMLKWGQQEILIGRALSKRLQNIQIGGKLSLGKLKEFTIAGIFDAKDSAFESEIWMDAVLFKDTFSRDDYQSLAFRLRNPSDFESLRKRIAVQGEREEVFLFDFPLEESALVSLNQQKFPALDLKAQQNFEEKIAKIPDLKTPPLPVQILKEENEWLLSFNQKEFLIKKEEKHFSVSQKIINDFDPRLKIHEMVWENEYYKKQSEIMAKLIFVLGVIISVIMSLGAISGAMNTMYASIRYRRREIGTLLALGFTPTQIWLSFIIESMTLAVFGGLIGCLLALPFNGIETGTTNWASFAESTFSFQIDSTILLSALAFSLIMGFLGGFFPAISAARLKVVKALRRD
jgi:ABC-type lipoprotein release transport system permease subunit